MNDSLVNICYVRALLDTRKEVNFAKHVIPKKFDYFVFQNSDLQQPLHQDEYFRSKSCKLLVLPSESICKNCHAENIKFKSEVNFKKAVLTAPAKLNAPVKFTSPDRIKLTLQQKRLECKQLEREISNMRKALDSDSKKVSSELSSDFQKLFSQCNEKEVPSFMKLFWEKQLKYISSSSPTSIRYHPMIIKFCLNLAAKSSSAYQDL